MSAPWPIQGVRVEGDTVVIKVTGGNEAARWLCGEILRQHEGAPSDLAQWFNAEAAKRFNGEMPVPISRNVLPLPRDADEAVGMVRVGESWLREHAPERLKQGGVL